MSLSCYAEFVTKNIKNICGRENSPSLCSFAKPDKLKQRYVFNEVWKRDLVNPRFFPLKHVWLFTHKRIADLVTLLHQLPLSPSPSPRHRYRPAVLAGTLNLLNVKCHLIKESLSTLLRDNIKKSSSTKKLDSWLLQADVFTSLVACSCK